MAVTPELPGTIVARNSEQEFWLREQVAKMCRLDHSRFPGSQPVSFGTKDLDKLETQDFWVCEKSDGVRVLFLIHTEDATKDQTLYLVDRHNIYHQLSGIFFPHHEDLRRPLRNTLIDGELVLDVDPRTQRPTLRLLAFDALVVDNQNVMMRYLDKRYGRLKEWFYKPYAQMMRDHPHMANSQPFDIKVKEINFSYHVEKVFNVDIPALQHGNDGLIYTCVNAPYQPGTDPNIMKWKPPSENSIDFKLVLRFPPMRNQSDMPDFHAKPVFQLHVWCGDERGLSKYDQYDEMYVDDDEWEKMKMSREQVDDRIVEVHWDPATSAWRMLRFRDDKPQGNHRNVVENIIQSIIDGVEKDVILARSNSIRNAWKARHGQTQGPTQPPPSQSLQSQHPPRPLPSTTRLPLPLSNLSHMTSASHAEIRYGPLPSSRWSKVSGPPVVAGMKR